MARRFKLPNRNQLITAGVGAAVGIGLYLWLSGQQLSLPAFEGQEYYGGEGEQYESGLFVSYDDGFTVGNRVTVS